jgi:AcrR family transcriptional regulator
MAKGSKLSGEETRARLVAAATQCLRELGYAGTSARTIARTAEVNSALVFYHFGSVDALLLAALDKSSEERMAAYVPLADQARTLEELVEVGTEVYRADLEGGHIAVTSELVAACVAREKVELRKQVVARTEPWLKLVEAQLERVIGGTPLGRLVPPRDLANAAVTFYLGANLFTVLDEDRTRTESLFGLARRLAPRARLLTMRLPGRRTSSR